MKGRPVGSKDSYKRDYTMTPSAWHQRVLASMKDGNSSKVLNAIFNNIGISETNKAIIEEEQLKRWKLLGTPTALLMSEYNKWATIIDAKLVSGLNPTDSEILQASKHLLDLAKEINRLTQVTAKDKLEVFSKRFDSENAEDIVYDVEEVVEDESGPEQSDSETVNKEVQ